MTGLLMGALVTLLASIKDLSKHKWGIEMKTPTVEQLQEAYIIAEKQGQIIRDHNVCVGTLYSEHLYWQEVCYDLFYVCNSFYYSL